MQVVAMDWLAQFDREIFNRLAEAGCHDVLLMDSWAKYMPVPEKYELDPLLVYLRDARAAGVRVRLAMCGSALQTPDDWYLKNIYGQYNEARAILHRESTTPTLHPILGWAYAANMSFTSYWHPEAEASAQRQITYLHGIVEAEGSVLLPFTGAGEYLFPPAQFIPTQPWRCSPWWFDRHAIQSWLRYCEEVPNPMRAGWVHREQLRITSERLALHSEKWSSLVPYWNDLALNTFDVDGIMEANREGLQTMLFTVFVNPAWEVRAAAQAQKYPTWCGVEGPYNLVTNGRKAHAAGFAGVICGFLWPSYGLQKVEPWVYDAVKQVSELQ